MARREEDTERPTCSGAPVSAFESKYPDLLYIYNLLARSHSQIAVPRPTEALKCYASDWQAGSEGILSVEQDGSSNMLQNPLSPSPWPTQHLKIPEGLERCDPTCSKPP